MSACSSLAFAVRAARALRASSAARAACTPCAPCAVCITRATARAAVAHKDISHEVLQHERRVALPPHQQQSARPHGVQHEV